MKRREKKHADRAGCDNRATRAWNDDNRENKPGAGRDRSGADESGLEQFESGDRGLRNRH